VIDLDTPLPGSPRALPRTIPAGSHVLSHADLRSIARHFAGKDSIRLGEELMFLIHPGMLGRDSGRVVPAEILAELGDGSHHIGRRVLLKFLANIRRQPAHYRSGGAVKVTKESVNFRQAEDNQFCARCSMFREPASCTAVEGRIHRVDLCDLYEEA
jgi:hypothetical protein